MWAQIAEPQYWSAFCRLHLELSELGLVSPLGYIFVGQRFLWGGQSEPKDKQLATSQSPLR